MLGELEFRRRSVSLRDFQTDIFAPFAILGFRNASTRDALPLPTISTAPMPTTIRSKNTISHFRTVGRLDLGCSTPASMAVGWKMGNFGKGRMLTISFAIRL